MAGRRGLEGTTRTRNASRIRRVPDQMETFADDWSLPAARLSGSSLAPGLNPQFMPGTWKAVGSCPDLATQLMRYTSNVRIDEASQGVIRQPLAD